MAFMPTKNLRLYKCSDGYYRTSWVDDSGNHLKKSFGKSPAIARDRFANFNTRWKSDRAVRNPMDVSQLSLRQAWERFEAQAKEYYRNEEGESTGEAEHFRYAITPLLELAGDEKLGAVTLAQVKAARIAMIHADLSVGVINHRMRRIRKIWRWFVEQEFTEPGLWHSMQALRPLAIGRPVEISRGEFKTPRVSKGVAPVPDEYVLQVANHLPRTIAAMIWFQYYTGARPGEVCRLRPVDVDTAGPVWIIRPHRHKTRHHGKTRTILVGPRARSYIEEFLHRDLQSPMFSPAEAWTQRHDAKTVGKQYANWPSYQQRKEDRLGRGGESYNPKSYARAIARACKDLGIPGWSPNQLRHNAATRLRKRYGLDVAQVVLGHSKADVTQIYAELDLDKAVSAMEAVG